MPPQLSGIARTGGGGIDISVGGIADLQTSLRALTRAGDSRANPLFNELRRARRAANSQLVKALRTAAPVGNYRRTARRRADNSRKVYRGRFAGQQQAAGELKRSVRARNQRRGSIVTLGGDAAYYINAILAGHKTPTGAVVAPNPFVWNVVRQVRPGAIRQYQRAVEKVAADFTAIYGQGIRFRAQSGRQRRLAR